MSFDAYTTSGQGQNLFQQLPIQSTRDPVNGVDYNDPGGGPYQIGRRWFNKSNDNYWRYQGQGIWILDSSNPGPILGIEVPAGASPINPDAAGHINFTSTANTITITGTAGGLGNQSINFDVAGGAVMEKFNVDAATAPGTNPVIPTTGIVTIEGGATYATGTRPKPIRTNSLAASTIDLEIQLAGSNAATSTANNFGVAQFDSNQFAVTSGFVQLKGGGVNPALTKLAVQTGTTPVVPSATGQITFNGATVAAGTNPVRTDGTGANTVALEVQTSQAIASTDATKIGLSAFNNTQFTVDANGFVNLTGTQGTWTPTLTFGGASTGIVYNTQEAKYTLIANILFYTVHFSITNLGSATGNAAITGFPYTIGSTSSQIGQLQIDNATFDVNYQTSFLRPITSGTTAELWESGTGVNSQNLTKSNFTAPTSIRAQGFYFV